MNKMTKGLFANIGIFTLTTFASRFMSFLILPLYTYYLTTAEYGTIDLVNTTISLLFPILSLSICDAVLRFGLDKKNDVKDIFSVGLNIVVAGTLLCFLLIPILTLSNIDTKIILFGILIYFLQGINTLFASFCKAIDKVREMAVITLAITFITLLFNVLFVAKLKYGIYGYWLSTILGNLIGALIYIIWCKILKYYRLDFGIFKSELVRNMLLYAIPLIPNALFWWINSSLDRLVLTAMTSVSVVGLYACANKIPTIISTISSIFSQAWTLSIFQSDTDNRKKFFETTYLFYNEVIFCCTIGVILLSKLLGSILFSKDFFSAWMFVPILTAGVYYNSLNSIIGAVFNAYNNSKFIFKTTVYGSVTNIVLNIPLVYLYGAMGAAIATLISYIVVWVVRVIKIKKMYGYIVDCRKALSQFFMLVLITVLIVECSNWILPFLGVFVYCIYFGIKYLLPILKRMLVER